MDPGEHRIDLRDFVPGASALQQHPVAGPLVTEQPGTPVLGSPGMILLMELASEAAVTGAIPDGWTTVGYAFDVRHRAPAPAGRTVTVCSTLVEVAGRKLTFEVVCRDGVTVVGEGRHTRAVVRRAAPGAGRG